MYLQSIYHCANIYERFFKKEVAKMSRVCQVSGVGPRSGNNRSHSLRATRRVWNANLQKYKVVIDGKEVTVRMTARAHRALLKNAK